MAAFRKHRMPNPTESCHFGRWAECASEVLRQRAGRDDSLPEEAAEETIQSEALEMQLMQVAAGAEQGFDGKTRSYQTQALTQTQTQSRLQETLRRPTRWSNKRGSSIQSTSNRAWLPGVRPTLRHFR